LGIRFLCALAERVREGEIDAAFVCGDEPRDPGVLETAVWFRRRFATQVRRGGRPTRAPPDPLRPRGPTRAGAPPTRTRRLRVETQLAIAVRRLRLAPEHVDRVALEIHASAGRGDASSLAKRLREVEARGALARERLVQANLRLVVWVARRY